MLGKGKMRGLFRRRSEEHETVLDPIDNSDDYQTVKALPAMAVLDQQARPHHKQKGKQKEFYRALKLT